ncbi:MAG: hypothetical protein ACXVPM_20825, partial [Bacteroidia bacterium]
MTASEKFKEWLGTEYYSTKKRGPISSGTQYVNGIENINGTLRLKGILKSNEDLFHINDLKQVTHLYDKYMSLPDRHK